MKGMITHCDGEAAYTLCGRACEELAENTCDDDVAPSRLAEPGEVITCPDCRRIITTIKKIKGFSALANRW
jgi:hypothetical protein